MARLLPYPCSGRIHAPPSPSRCVVPTPGTTGIRHSWLHPLCRINRAMTRITCCLISGSHRSFAGEPRANAGYVLRPRAARMCTLQSAVTRSHHLILAWVRAPG